MGDVENQPPPVLLRLFAHGDFMLDPGGHIVKGVLKLGKPFFRRKSTRAE